MTPADSAVLNFFLNASIGAIAVFVLWRSIVLNAQTTKQSSDNLKAVVDLAGALVKSTEATEAKVADVGADVKRVADKVQEVDADAEASRIAMRNAVTQISGGMTQLSGSMAQQMDATTKLVEVVTQNPVQHATLLEAIHANGQEISTLGQLLRETIGQPVAECILQLTEVASTMARAKDLEPVLRTLHNVQTRLSTLEERISAGEAPPHTMS